MHLGVTATTFKFQVSNSLLKANPIDFVEQRSAQTFRQNFILVPLAIV